MSYTEEIKEETAEQKIERLEKHIIYLKNKLRDIEELNNFYETDGKSNLFYSVNRKSNEMSAVLNKYNLTTMDLTDKSKEFERLRIFWQDSTELANTLKSLEQTAGVTGDEGKDLQPKFRITPESIADNMGNIAGSQKK